MAITNWIYDSSRDAFVPARGRVHGRRRRFARFPSRCALYAAYELGLYAAAGRPGDGRRARRRLRVGPARLRALFDVLVLEGALLREPFSNPPAYAAPPVLPPRPPAPPPQGWGRLAEALREDRPQGDANLPEAGPELTAFHQHLARTGTAPARELAATLARELGPGERFLDAGGGQGAYTAALLAAARAHARRCRPARR